MAVPVLSPISLFDVDLLAELHRRCFTAIWDRPWTAKSFAEILGMPGITGEILRLGDEPAGFALALQTLDEIELLLIAVLPERRGQGLALTLLDSLLTKAAAGGAQRALLEVAEGNIPAISTYTKVGFTTCGRRKQYYPGPTDALLFEKLLNSSNINDKAYR